MLVDIFGSPYGLGFFRHPEKIGAIVVSYQDTKETQTISAEVISGGLPASGTLPVTVSDRIACGSGIRTLKVRLEYVLPEEIGIPSAALDDIDSIAQEGITAKAYPGCQVLFARDGKVFYQKAFGHFRYSDTISTRIDDLYDLASLTKVAATTLAIMKLYEQGKIKLDNPLGKYLPQVKGSNKSSLTIRQIMAHQAGLQPWIPFYKKTLIDGKPDPEIYQKTPSDRFPFRVAGNVYIRKDYRDSIYQAIIRSPLLGTKDYKYSDIGFYLLQLVIERITGESLNTYVRKEFYDPLGLATLGYMPLNRFPVSRIAPTETELTFRRRRSYSGDVHDPGAAMLGGSRSCRVVLEFQ